MLELRHGELAAGSKLERLMVSPQEVSSGEALSFSADTAENWVKAVKESPDQFTSWAALHLGQIVLQLYIALTKKKEDEHGLLRRLSDMQTELHSYLSNEGELSRGILDREAILTQRDLREEADTSGT